MKDFQELSNGISAVFLKGMGEIPKSKAVGFIRKPVDKDKFLNEFRRFF